MRLPEEILCQPINTNIHRSNSVVWHLFRLYVRVRHRRLRRCCVHAANDSPSNATLFAIFVCVFCIFLPIPPPSLSLTRSLFRCFYLIFIHFWFACSCNCTRHRKCLEREFRHMQIFARFLFCFFFFFSFLFSASRLLCGLAIRSVLFKVNSEKMHSANYSNRSRCRVLGTDLNNTCFLSAAFSRVFQTESNRLEIQVVYARAHRHTQRVIDSIRDVRPDIRCGIRCTQHKRPNSAVDVPNRIK